MAKAQAVMPWWLENGTEICSICHHLYLYETEFRCSDCDGPTCPNCVEIRHAEAVICLPCLQTDQAKAGKI